MYATVEQLVALFGERTVRDLSCRGEVADDVGDPGGTLDRAVLEEAIRGASSEVDSYLGLSRAVPLPEPIPPVVTAVTADIVRYRLTSGDLEEDDVIVRRYARAIDWLREAARGGVRLPGEAGVEPVGGVDIDPGTRPWDGVSL